MDNLGKITDGLSEMETPLLQTRSLAMAVRMMAAAHELPKEARDALDAVADLLFVNLSGLCEDRTRLWRLALKETKEAGDV
jgi:hypothetical protein